MCKWFTFTLDLHVVYTAIDTYTHNTGQDPTNEGSHTWFQLCGIAFEMDITNFTKLKK
jgi:hypothetical protein